MIPLSFTLSFVTEKSCGNAGDLPNGHFEYERSAYIGEKVYAVCHTGSVAAEPNLRHRVAAAISAHACVCVCVSTGSP